MLEVGADEYSSPARDLGLTVVVIACDVGSATIRHALKLPDEGIIALAGSPLVFVGGDLFPLHC